MSASIPTSQSLAAGSRRLDRRNALVAHVLTEMRRGAILRRTYTNHGVWWTLDWRRVAPEIAAIVITTAAVEPLDDGLFPGTAQTFRAKA